ncbi:MAG: VWA domain-containing protein [Bacillota bacterium]
MLSDVFEFVKVLRSAGVNTATSEIMDFLKALSLTGVGPGDFKTAAGATLIKQIEHVAVLDRLWELYWGRPRQITDEGKKPAAPETPPRMSREEFMSRVQSYKDFMRNEKMRLQEEKTVVSSCGPGGVKKGAGIARGGMSGAEKFVSLILGGNKEEMRAFIREAVSTLDFEDDESNWLRRLKIITGWAEGEDYLRSRRPCDPGISQSVIGDRLAMFMETVERERDRELWKKDRRSLFRRLNAGERHFNEIDYEQAQEIKRRIVLLGKKLATRKGYRYVTSPSGKKVDLRKTVSLAAKHSGVPVRLLFRDRIPSRPELVILCDLSGSVATFSKFMLLLVSAMHDKFRSVRSFAFVDAIEEVTGMIRGWDAEKKIAEIIRNTGIWQTGFSDYGSVWRQFEEEHKDVVSDKTNLIILGDAKNNYKPVGADYFQSIAERARRVIWLNPAPMSRWDAEDGVMSAYAPFCHCVMECRNLKQLERVAGQVFN